MEEASDTSNACATNTGRLKDTDDNAIAIPQRFSVETAKEVTDSLTAAFQLITKAIVEMEMLQDYSNKNINDESAFDTHQDFWVELEDFLVEEVPALMRASSQLYEKLAALVGTERDRLKFEMVEAQLDDLITEMHDFLKVLEDDIRKRF